MGNPYETLKADVVSISGNTMVVQLSGTGAAPTAPFINIGAAQNVCELVIDAWGD